MSTICRRLDGLPLALELAAARARLLSPSGTCERLEHPLDLLTVGARNLPTCQQTLRATIAWSYDLLSDGNLVNAQPLIEASLRLYQQLDDRSGQAEALR